MTTPLSSSHTLHQLFEPFRFWAGDQLVVPIGVTHISLPEHQIQSREQEKKEQNEQTLGLNSSAEGELCNTLCMCRLTLAWVNSETSTKQLECRLILTRSSFTGLDPISSDWSHRSGVRCRLPLSVVPCQLPSSSFSQLTLFSRAPSLPVTARFQVQNPFSRQNRQRNRLLGGPPT